MFSGSVSESLAQFGTGTIASTVLNVVSSTANHLEFSLTYTLTASASKASVTQVVEKYQKKTNNNYAFFKIIFHSEKH